MECTTNPGRVWGYLVTFPEDRTDWRGFSPPFRPSSCVAAGVCVCVCVYFLNGYVLCFFDALSGFLKTRGFRSEGFIGLSSRFLT